MPSAPTSARLPVLRRKEARLRQHYRFPFEPPYAHEFIMVPEFTEQGITELDVAKRLIDHSIHPPTMSWPVAHCLMIEPTESESLATLDGFVEAHQRVAVASVALPATTRLKR